VKIVHTVLWPHYPNKNIFSDHRNRLYSKSASLRCGGKLFHRPGPAAAQAVTKALSSVPAGQFWRRIAYWLLVSSMLWRCWLGDRKGIRSVNITATTLFLAHHNSIVIITEGCSCEARGLGNACNHHSVPDPSLASCYSCCVHSHGVC